MKSKIWKLQRPLFASGGHGEVLAYTEGKENVAMIFMTKSVMDKLFGDEVKVYVKGKVKAGNLVVDSYVEDQPW